MLREAYEEHLKELRAEQASELRARDMQARPTYCIFAPACARVAIHVCVCVGKTESEAAHAERERER